MPKRGYILSAAAMLLAIVSLLIVWHLVTTDYPVHSDVFFMGVEAGVLAAMLLVCFVLIGFLLYRLITTPDRSVTHSAA